MAYLGRDGAIELRRNSPEPVVVPPSAVSVANNYVVVDYDDWLLGEQVTLIHTTGVLQGYIYRSQLDRIFFHSTLEGALSNTVATRLSFASVDISKPIVLAAGINATQLTTLTTFQATLTTLTYEKRLRGWPTTSTAVQAQATVNPWKLQGEVKSWQLSRAASEIETGSLGEQFTTFVKSTVSGSGSLDFLVNLYARENYNDVDPMLRLVQLTEQGSTATVKLYLKKQTNAGTRTDQWGTTSLFSAALFFRTTILFTASSVNVTAEDLVVGSASFVTTGPIRLLSE